MRLPTWALVLITVSGWVAAGGIWILELPAKINSFNSEYQKTVDWWNLNAKITGTWTSNVEGWVDATDEDRRLQGGEQGPVILQIRVYGGAAEGEVYSEGLKSSYVASRIFLKGDTHGSDRVDGVIYDYIGGEPKALAQFELSYLKNNGKESLRLSTIKQSGPFLPLETKLYRDDKAMPDDLGGLSPWWTKALFDYVKSHKLTKPESP